MSTVITRKVARDSGSDSETYREKSTVTSNVIEIPELGAPRKERQFLWESQDKSYDPDHIGTQPSVFDDPATAANYQPPSTWENLHRFNPLARWTWREEDKVIRKVDMRILIWTCVMFIGLEIDRANIGQALTDNFLPDLGLDTNDFNLGNTVFAVSFLSAELPSQLVSKWVGPDIWIPSQLVLWSIVAAAQFWLSGRTSFLVCRCLIGFLQGGFIPDVILYLSYFYKHAEMGLRLGSFWMAMTFADILAAFLAFGILHMRGVLGLAGWRWMFLIEGLLTMVIGILSFGMMPASPTQTASWFRGRNGWFTPREEEIIVNRVIRDDPSKSSMHNRERITITLLWRSMKDFDLWPIYLIGFTNMVPWMTPKYYLTLTLRGLGFDTFRTNLLVIPSQVLAVVTMLSAAWLADRTKRVIPVAMAAMIWLLPFVVWLRVGYDLESSPWSVYAVVSLLVAAPLSHPILVGLASRNSNSVRSRTVSAALYNMSVQVGSIISANIYRAEDAPLYRKGNSVLLGIISYNLVMFTGVILYYRWRNASRDKTWTAFSDDEKLDYLCEQNQHDRGNKRLDFRFHS